MLCHECVMTSQENPAVALCELCQVGWCTSHLVALYESQPEALLRARPAKPTCPIASDDSHRLTNTARNPERTKFATST
jgi:hypothetical protein